MPSFKTNGRGTAVDVPPDVPLLWVLREELQLPGTKFGCGKGLCGACTVLVDGMPTRSCVMPVVAVEGRSVTTIEGLGDGRGGLHPVQRAWIELNVTQCGYCQSGQLMAAAALVDKGGVPTEAEIREALNGNLCRCGTYQRVVAAVQLAAQGAARGR
ncbi:MAG: (2Fe-2S)-binding protein [Betaproteobacteria bacterium]|jgi:isoquinoline 1-oxidoreductase alpha subunit